MFKIENCWRQNKNVRLDVCVASKNYKRTETFMGGAKVQLHGVLGDSVRVFRIRFSRFGHRILNVDTLLNQIELTAVHRDGRREDEAIDAVFDG